MEAVHSLFGVQTLFYTRLRANIDPLKPDELAKLAWHSARSTAIPPGSDGISYLIAAKRNGIVTPLSAAYEQEIKSLASGQSLEEAREMARRSAR